MHHYLAALGALCLALPAQAADIRIAPADSIVANPANPNRGYTDLVVHAIAVRAAEGERFQVESIRIELLAAGTPVLTEQMSGEQLARSTADIMAAPIPAFINGQVLNREGLAGLFGAATAPARTADLAPTQALVSGRHYYAVRGPIDAVRVTLQGRAPDGTAVTAERVVPVAAHRSPIDYRPPVRGTWLMQAIPTLQSHHRLNPSTEFAVDFFKVDDQGRLAASDPLIATNSYGYGADVVAAADGEVVRVTDGEIQDRAAMMRRADETPQAAGERIGAYNMQRMARDFERAVGGNLVVIRHERDGVVEFSSYGHLRQGIPVRVGQRVRQGEVIGQVGDTGDSPSVHLHFQVNAAADPFASKSLPVRFNGLRNAGGNSELGRFVIAE